MVIFFLVIILRTGSVTLDSAPCTRARVSTLRTRVREARAPLKLNPPNTPHLMQLDRTTGHCTFGFCLTAMHANTHRYRFDGAVVLFFVCCSCLVLCCGCCS